MKRERGDKPTPVPEAALALVECCFLVQRDGASISVVGRCLISAVCRLSGETAKLVYRSRAVPEQIRRGSALMVEHEVSGTVSLDARSIGGNSTDALLGK